MRDFACGYIIEFSDGGESEEQVLHRGSREDCERLLDLLPAVAYSGSRPVSRCFAVIVPTSEASDG